MDSENFRNILIIDTEKKYRNKIFMMMKFATNHKDIDVPDPYYGGEQGFEYVLDLLEDACSGLLKHIVKKDLQN